jgi:hypothetical protein
MVAAKKQALFLALDNSLCVALSKLINFISVLPFAIPTESQVVLCPRRKMVHTRHLAHESRNALRMVPTLAPILDSAMQQFCHHCRCRVSFYEKPIVSLKF